MSSSIVATITDTGSVDVQQGGRKKTISIRDFTSAITSLTAETAGDSASSGVGFKLPSSVHSFIPTATGYVVNLYYPETEAELRYTGLSSKFTSYIPNVLISVILQKVNGKDGEFAIRDMLWYATDKSRIALPYDWTPSSSNHIWILPFPNMYGNGSMCTGANRIPSVIYTDWTILDMLYNDVLLGSAFNNDLTIRSVPETGNAGTWMRTLRDWYLDENTTGFPYTKLSNY